MSYVKHTTDVHVSVYDENQYASGISSRYGYQTIDKVVYDSLAMGLGADTYDLNVNINGAGARNIDLIVASAAITWGQLVTLIQNAIDALVGPAVDATVSITNGLLRVTSDTAGATSSVALTAGTVNDILAALSVTVNTAVAGVASALFAETVHPAATALNKGLILIGGFNRPVNKVNKEAKDAVHMSVNREVRFAGKIDYRDLTYVMPVFDSKWVYRTINQTVGTLPAQSWYAHFEFDEEGGDKAEDTMGCLVKSYTLGFDEQGLPIQTIVPQYYKAKTGIVNTHSSGKVFLDPADASIPSDVSVTLDGTAITDFEEFELVIENTLADAPSKPGPYRIPGFLDKRNVTFNCSFFYQADAGLRGEYISNDIDEHTLYIKFSNIDGTFELTIAGLVITETNDDEYARKGTVPIKYTFESGNVVFTLTDL
jgi:hypothetical protein